MIQRQPGDCLSGDVVKGRLNARVRPLVFRPADSIRRRAAGPCSPGCSGPWRAGRWAVQNSGIWNLEVRIAGRALATENGGYLKPSLSMPHLPGRLRRGHVAEQRSRSSCLVRKHQRQGDLHGLCGGDTV
jgi:hypothetical protein